MPQQYIDPEILFQVMRRKNISPVTLIDKLGVESRTLGKWLTGEATPQPGSLHQLAQVLGVPRESLLEQS
jgi:transcriptional regulator with XRE-family HTH domain